MKKKNGYILLEVMIWSAIFLILTGGYISICSSIVKDMKFDICINTFVKDLQTLIMTSITTHQVLKIVFYPMDNYYQFETEENGFNVTGKYIKRIFPN